MELHSNSTNACNRLQACCMLHFAFCIPQSEIEMEMDVIRILRNRLGKFSKAILIDL